MSKRSPNFVIKVGASETGFKAIRELTRQGVRTNATLIFSVAQAWHAARAGATYISPFLGWKEQHGDSIRGFIRETRTHARQFWLQVGNHRRRDPQQPATRRRRRRRRHCATAALALYQEIFRNPYTDMGEQIFQDAWDATPQ